jgi:hypothetical protein
MNYQEMAVLEQRERKAMAAQIATVKNNALRTNRVQFQPSKLKS